MHCTTMAMLRVSKLLERGQAQNMPATAIDRRLQTSSWLGLGAVKAGGKQK